MTRSAFAGGDYETTRVQRLVRCDKCGGQPWTLCFWWDTPEGPSGCPEGGNVFTCGMAAWQKDMHEFRLLRQAHIGTGEAIRTMFKDTPHD